MLIQDTTLSVFGKNRLLSDDELPRDHSSVVSSECPFGFPRLGIEFEVGYTIRSERICFLIEVQNTSRVVGDRVVKLLVWAMFLHVIFPPTTLAESEHILIIDADPPIVWSFRD